MTSIPPPDCYLELDRVERFIADAIVNQWAHAYDNIVDDHNTDVAVRNLRTAADEPEVMYVVAAAAARALSYEEIVRVDDPDDVQTILDLAIVARNPSTGDRSKPAYHEAAARRLLDDRNRMRAGDAELALAHATLALSMRTGSS